MHPPARRRALRVAALAAGAALVASCSPGALLNRLVPTGTYQRTPDLAYGPDVRHRLDVYRPTEASRPAPVVVFFYGGNWSTGRREDYLFVGEALASRGFVAVIPDYRLFPQVRFPRFLDDGALSVRWARDHAGSFGGMGDRIVLMGHSAGAYIAAMLALDPAYLRAADVRRSDIRGFVGLAGPYDFLPLQGDITRKVFGYPQTSVETQPIHFVTAASPPALLITGEADRIVDPGNSARLASRLADSGVPVKRVVYPNLGHRLLVGALASPLRRVDPVLDEVAAFVEKVGNATAAGARAPEPAAARAARAAEHDRATS